jgi:integrase
MEERELHRRWRRTVTRAGVRFRPAETLRHACISSLLSRGAPLLAVAAQTGHSPRVMLGSYARFQEPPAQPSATQPQPAVSTA